MLSRHASQDGWGDANGSAAGAVRRAREGNQLFAPVACANALWLMLVPISDSSLVTYSETCSSLRLRCRVSFNFLISSEARSAAGTVTSVTRNTIQSPPAAPGAWAVPSL